MRIRDAETGRIRPLTIVALATCLLAGGTVGAGAGGLFTTDTPAEAAGDTIAKVASGQQQDRAADPGMTPPPRNDSATETVYMVKGYDETREVPPGVSCNYRWSTAIKAMKEWGWAKSKKNFVQVGFYKEDFKCDINLAKKDGTRDLSIKELGRRLAWNIHLNHSRWGRSVDVIGHSMGSLIIRAALAGTERGEKDWPPYVYVEDAVTLGGPHQGAWLSDYCLPSGHINEQCNEMARTSPFMNWLGKTDAGQAEGGTDWTAIGSKTDEAVLPGSATPRNIGIRHLVRYSSEAGINHGDLRLLTEGTYPMEHSNDAGSNWKDNDAGAAPLRAAFNALYFHSRW
ncbi:esterase/lipase family protein [Streptomyces niveus]|uniref:esterase/lipase family protein n=1 Tax=Streptomyces niveus TaxID=193462 RepID=UPI0036302623